MLGFAILWCIVAAGTQKEDFFNPLPVPAPPTPPRLEYVSRSADREVLRLQAAIIAGGRAFTKVTLYGKEVKVALHTDGTYTAETEGYRVVRENGAFVTLATMLINKGVIRPNAVSDDRGPSDMEGEKCVLRQAGAPLWAPIPASEVPVPLAPGTRYRFAEIRDGIYWVTDTSYIFLVALANNGEAIVVDAPGSSFTDRNAQGIPTGTTQVVNAIRDIIGSTHTVTYFIYSHAHADHNSGAGAVIAAFSPPNIISSTLARDILITRADPTRPVPTQGVTTETITVGNHAIELSGGGLVGHSAGDLTINFINSNVVMQVDLLNPGWGFFKGFGLANDVARVEAQLQSILSKMAAPNSVFVPGHLHRLGTKGDIEQALALLADFRQGALLAFSTIDRADIARRSGRADPNSQNYLNFYGTASLFADVAATICADYVVPRWRGIVAGVDVFAHANCDTMVDQIPIL